MRRQGRSVTQLYDSACELLFAAQQLRAAAGERDALPATAATIGCIDATLDALAQAVDEMRDAAVTELDSDKRAAAAIGREFALLADAVRDAQEACDEAREHTAPILAQLSLS
jgi:hypothetical protein